MRIINTAEMVPDDLPKSYVNRSVDQARDMAAESWSESLYFRVTRIASVLNVKTDVPMETLKRSFQLPLAL